MRTYTYKDLIKLALLEEMEKQGKDLFALEEQLKAFEKAGQLIQKEKLAAVPLVSDAREVTNYFMDLLNATKELVTIPAVAGLGLGAGGALVTGAAQDQIDKQDEDFSQDEEKIRRTKQLLRQMELDYPRH